MLGNGHVRFGGRGEETDQPRDWHRASPRPNTALMDLTGWPPGMRVIVRKERPHPGAQLRFTDADGLRITAFATNTSRGQLADLELRHRRRARCEDRIRGAKDSGLENLPLHDMDQNRIWCAIVSLACELVAWLQMLTLVGHPARPLGTQTATAAAVLRRGPPGPQRPPRCAAPEQGRHPDRPAPAHPPQPSPPAPPRQLTQDPFAPTTASTRPVEPTPPERPRAICHTHTAQSPPDGAGRRRNTAPAGSRKIRGRPCRGTWTDQRTQPREAPQL